MKNMKKKISVGMKEPNNSKIVEYLTICFCRQALNQTDLQVDFKDGQIKVNPFAFAPL